MKKLLLPVFAVSALLLNSCSTTQLARQTDSSNDDVYYTEAKAKVIAPAVAKAQSEKQEKTYRTDEQLYNDERYSSDRFQDDYSYSSRINRFYYNSPYRPYYDYRYSYGYNPWYTYSYDPFFYDPWLFRPGVSVWVNVGRYSRPYYNNYYGYYGSGYNNGYWGPYSYYNTYPGYGYGGYYGGGNYYGGRTGYNRPSSPRPNREGGMGRTSGRIDNPQGGGVSVPNNGRPSRGSSVPDRDRQGPDGRISSDQGTATAQPSGSSRPSRGSSVPDRDRQGPDGRIGSDQGTTAQPSSSGTSRPSRTQETSQPRQQPAPDPRPAQVESSRPERTYSPPPSSSGSSNDSGTGSSGGSSGGGRPSRGGR